MIRLGVIVVTGICSATAATAFEGKYGYRDGAGHGAAEITRRADGSYAARFEIGVPGCLGDMEAAGRETAGLLRLKTTDAGGICDVEVRRTAAGIEVKEVGPCDMHGARCSFSGPYRAAGGAPAAAKAPDTAGLQGQFYCADETRLDRKQIDDPNHRMTPPTGATISPAAYDFFFHAGTLGFTIGGDTFVRKPVKVTIRGDSAIYVGPNGAKWAVNPVGARTAVLAGTGLTGVAKLYACSWR